jgi:hypothetical protein
MTTAGTRATWAHTAGMTALLAMLVATIFIVPVAAPPLGDSGRAVIELFFLLVLLAGAWAIAEHRRAAFALAVLGEALVGQLYPAIILARLVTLQTSEPPAAPPAT